jgi:hypothetical protein
MDRPARSVANAEIVDSEAARFDLVLLGDNRRWVEGRRGDASRQSGETIEQLNTTILMTFETVAKELAEDGARLSASPSRSRGQRQMRNQAGSPWMVISPDNHHRIARVWCSV